jgi:Tol biopolymer transport system component
MKSFATCSILFILLCFQFVYGGWKIATAPVKLAGGEGENYMHPVWSTTSDWIAFTSIGYQGIWVINSRSHEIKKLTDEQGSGFGFSWSNTGKEIVCIITDYEGKKPFNQLKIFDIENDSSWTVTNGKQRFRGLPRWSIDDQQVYIMGKRKIHIFESKLKKSEAMTTPQNKQMVFLKSGKIVVETFDQVTEKVFEPVNGMGIINLVISPDRRKMAFEVYGGNMYVMNVDGTGLTDLGVGYRPQWCPDGEYLAYMITEDDGYRFTQSDIYTIKIDGSDKTNLTNTNDILEMNPSWSPEGNRIVFDNYNEGSIYVVEVENSL